MADLPGRVKTRFVGFFRGAPYGASGDPEIVAGALSRETANVVSNYLSSGHVFAVSPVRAPDLLNPQEKLSSLRYFTDGEWVWPSDLVYYVDTYRAELPKDFEMHVLHQERVPELIFDEDIKRVKKDFRDRRASSGPPLKSD
jgi:hypothetical protein